MLGYSPSCIKQIILSITFMKPRSLCINILVLFTFYTFIRIRGSKAFNSLLHFPHFTLQRNHIIIQLHVINIRISPIQIGLPVIINKNSRINKIPTAIIKRLTDSIFKMTKWRTTYCYTNSHGIG